MKGVDQICWSEEHLNIMDWKKAKKSEDYHLHN